MPRLHHHLQHLLATSGGQAVPVSRVVAQADDRGYALAVLLLTIPFVLPMPTLGMALPIGSFLALAGLTLALGRHPVLPGFLRRRRIAYPALQALARVSRAQAGGPSRSFLRPRLGFMLAGPGRSALGLSMAVAAVILALPLPLPLSNFFPAAAILLLALGMLEGDGLMVLAGHVAAAAVGVGLYLASGAVVAGAQRALAWVL
jgi:hypothetical protein